MISSVGAARAGLGGELVSGSLFSLPGEVDEGSGGGGGGGEATGNGAFIRAQIESTSMAAAEEFGIGFLLFSSLWAFRLQ